MHLDYAKCYNMLVDLSGEKILSPWSGVLDFQPMKNTRSYFNNYAILNEIYSIEIIVLHMIL